MTTMMSYPNLLTCSHVSRYGMNIDPQDRWQCQVCGQKWSVPSLARDCEKADRAYATQPVDWLERPKRVERP